jgi:hypothetical protein
MNNMISKQVFKKRIDIFFQRIISAVLILPNVISTDQLLIGNTVPVRTRVSGTGGIIDLLDKYEFRFLSRVECPMSRVRVKSRG